MKKSLVFLSLTFSLFLAGCQTACTTYSPLIGITSIYEIKDQNDLSASASVDFSYIQPILDNGGTPLILPTIKNDCAIKQYVRHLDGLVLIGGDDIPPAAYGQIPHESVKPMSPQRYDFESKLIGLWLKSKKPILGICLGMQFTNVVSGGTLIQDIPSQVSTEIDHRAKQKLHNVKIIKGSILHRILKTETASVYSSHHQAVDKVGNKLKVVARSPDGVIEALERTSGGFGLFVQWHPELMEDKNHRDAIYAALIKAARKHRQIPMSNWLLYERRGPLFSLTTMD